MSKSTWSSGATAACRAANSVAIRSPMRRSRPRRPRIGGVVRLRHRHRPRGGGPAASPCVSGGPRPDRAVHRPRRARRARSVSAGRSSNLLKALAALLVPSRAHASTASAAASMSSSRRCSLVGPESRQDVVDGAPVRLADAHAQAAELLVAQLVDDRAQAVVATRAAALAEAQLAEGQREVVGHDEQVGEWRVFAGQDLAHGAARVVHERERLDQRDVQPAEPPADHVGGIALPATTRPAGPLREPVDHEPADVVPRPRVLRPGVPEPDDDLHPTLRGQHDRARSRSGRSDPPAGGPGRRW